MHMHFFFLPQWVADFVVVDVVEVKAAFWQHVVEKGTMRFTKEENKNKGR